MNIMPSLRHIAFASLTLGALLSQAWATSCGGGPGVFSVWGDDGRIAIGSDYSAQTATCNPSFSGGEYINVKVSSFFEPRWIDVNDNNALKPACSVLGTSPREATPTDLTLSRYTLPIFPSNTRNVDIAYTHPEAFISVGDIPNVDQGCGSSSSTCRLYQQTSNNKNLKWKIFGTNNPEYTSDDGASFPQTSGDPLVISNKDQRVYRNIYAQAAKLYFKYDGTQPYVINSLRVGNNGTEITFEPGDYYFNTFSFTTAILLKVAGTGNGGGKVNIYVKNADSSSFIGHGSCINISGISTFDQCTALQSSTSSPRFSLDTQQPSKLAFWFYGGNLTLNDTVYMAASIYNDSTSGEIYIRATNNTSFVGEMVAKNIRIENQSPVYMHYKDTGSFNSIYPGFTSGRTGLYSPARPAVPQVATAGDYSFIAYQSDYSSSANQKNYGTLRAYALRADGTTETTAAWDANNLMTESDRRNKLYVDVNGTAVAVGSLTLANLTTIGLSTTGLAITDVQNRIAQGPGAILSSKWQGMLGKPNATQPVIFKDMVLFTTSEGILYALDRQTGALRWGWVPKDLVGGFVSDSAYEAQLAGEGMKGQINAVTINGVDYVMGTAKNGEIHYGLQLNATTGLPARVWYDVRAGKTSPNAEKPVVYLDRAVYVVDDKVIVRPVAGGNPDTDPNSAPNVGGGTIKSSPTIVQTGTNYNLLVGTSNGYVMTASLASNGNLGSFNQVGYTGFNEAITYVVYTKTVDYEYVTAQSKTRVTTFKRRVNTTNNWTKIWSTTLGSASEWDFATGTSKGTTTVPALPGTGEITDRVTSLGGYIGIPFTIPASGDSCDGTARLYLAPLDPTLSYYAIYYLGQSFSDPYLALGTGNALSAQGMYLDGRMMMQGHSEMNLTGAEGLDNPLEFVPIPPNKGPGRKSWREVLVN